MLPNSDSGFKSHIARFLFHNPKRKVEFSRGLIYDKCRKFLYLRTISNIY